MKIRKPKKDKFEGSIIRHVDHGYVEDLGPAPDSYKTPSRVVKLQSGLIARVPEDELEEK